MIAEQRTYPMMHSCGARRDGDPLSWSLVKVRSPTPPSFSPGYNKSLSKASESRFCDSHPPLQLELYAPCQGPSFTHNAAPCPESLQ